MMTTHNNEPMRRLQPTHPATLFALLTLLLLLLTWIAEAYGVQTLHPSTNEVVAVRSVLNAEGMRWLLRHAVSNLYDYSSLGQVLLGLFSLGMAYHSGLVNALTGTHWLRRLGQRGTVVLVIALGAGSHLLDDVGYLLLLPLSASLFRNVGLSPATGMLTSLVAIGCTAIHYALFLSVTGLLLLPLLYILSIRWLLPSSAKACCPLKSLSSVCQGTTKEKDIAPATALTQRERRALTSALTAGALYAGLIIWGIYAMSDLFLGVDGSLTHSPLMEGMVPIVCLGLAWMAGVYGFVSGRYRSDVQLLEGASSYLPLLCDYFLLLLCCAELSALFDYSNLGSYLAIEGAQWLCTLQLPTSLLMLLFILFTALINLLIVPTELKWQLLYPYFLPLFQTLHVSPEATLSAFCIGDTTTNVLSPFLLYLPLVLAILRHEQPQATYTTLLAHTGRISLALLTVWMLLYALWSALEWPFAL